MALNVGITWMTLVRSRDALMDRHNAEDAAAIKEHGRPAHITITQCSCITAQSYRELTHLIRERGL